MKSPARRYYFTISALLFLFFFAWSSTYSLFASWLGHTLHFDSMITGFVFTANAIAALIFQPVYGFIQDRLGTSKKLLVWVGVMLVLCTPVMGRIYPWLLSQSLSIGMTVGAIYLAVSMFAGVGVVESYSERAARNAGFEFGGARLWGSVGWGLGTLVAGRFEIMPDLPFYACSAAGVVFLFVLASLNDGSLLVKDKPKQAQQISSLGQSFVLFKQGDFWKMTVFLFGISGLYFLFDQQFQNYYSTFFEPGQGARAFSMLFAAQTLTETILLLFSPFIVRTLGSRNSMLLCGALMGLRLLGCSLINDVWFLSACQLLRGVEIPILLVAVFKYINGVFDARYSSTIYLISFQFAQQFYSICFSAATGYGFASIGYQNTYLVLAGSALLFTLWGIFMLPRIPAAAWTPRESADTTNASSTQSVAGAQTT